ncbi:MAG: hypothetical protein ABI348_10485 [Nitrososphaera sp.]
MNTKNNASIVIALAAVLAVAMVPASLQQAFAHAHTEMAVQDEHLEGKSVSMVVGHTSEPTFGAEPGIHDGKHNLEVLLSDAATKLPLTNASLTADKYYFKDIGSFNNASSVQDADQIVKNVTIGAVFGDPWHYMARQVQKAGIYGYHIYGTIDYFGMAKLPIDTTVFCKSDGGNTTKFNSVGWSGGFGCTADINGIAFPSSATSGDDAKGGNDKADHGHGHKDNSTGVKPGHS